MDLEANTESRIPPPTYEDGFSEVDAPPAYDSLFGRLKTAKRDSSGNVNFLRNMCKILTGGVCLTVGLALLFAIPVSMMVIGSMNLHKCKAERFIPIYLIVAGVFGAIRSISSIIQRAFNHSNDKEEENSRTNPFDGIVTCFLFIWFIAGNVWIYRTYDNWDDNPEADNYCDYTLYWFAFWITTASYILICLACCVGCCAVCLAALFS